MNDKEIERIANQEQKVLLAKMYLWVLFFILSALVFWTFVKAVMESMANPAFDIKQDQMAATKIIIALSLFAVALVIGYLYDKKLSKKLDKLWEQKKALF